MKTKKVVLSAVEFVCPATGKICRIGATVFVKAADLMQMPLVDDTTTVDLANAYEAREEAERHG